MESTKQASSAPQPKRRRWLIAAVLLFVVSLVSWWNCPRGDARFVGKWAVQEASIALLPKVVGIALTADGRGRIDLGHSTCRCRWWTEDGDFVCYVIPDRGWGPVGDFAHFAYARITGSIHPTRQRILSADPHRLRLETNVTIDDRLLEQTLTRIPE